MYRYHCSPIDLKARLIGAAVARGGRWAGDTSVALSRLKMAFWHNGAGMHGREIEMSVRLKRLEIAPSMASNVGEGCRRRRRSRRTRAKRRK